MRTEMIHPPAVLVDWAARFVPGIRHAWDRPWRQVRAAIADRLLRRNCKCGESYQLQARRTADVEIEVLLGQCERCEAVYWCYRRVEA